MGRKVWDENEGFILEKKLRKSPLAEHESEMYRVCHADVEGAIVRSKVQGRRLKETYLSPRNHLSSIRAGSTMQRVSARAVC